MQVSFIIPLYNCLPLTQAMHASLEATLPAGLDYEVVFIDDGSTDGTREWLATLRGNRIRVLLNERNLGYARANNRAVAAAGGELLALLNNDLLLLPGWLEPMLEAQRTLGARAGLVGNVQLDTSSGVVDHAGIVINVQGKPVHARALPPRRVRRSSAVWPVPAVTGACMLVERELWHRLGGFDEEYVNGGEDIDLCFRARAAGRENVVALDSVVQHHVSSSTGRKLRDEENSYRLARRWRREFLAAADHGAREWAHAHLAHAFANPRALDYQTTLRALAFLLRLRTTRPPEAEGALAAGLAREFERWEGMFGSVADSVARESTRMGANSPTEFTNDSKGHQG